ncbi:MAG TPA: peptidylprolyl isomerase [candidate division Zixibacteria bacterium]|nr:peptidylprolyl isomerase [candidate division Zixibacteria bacterium]MDD4918981.1 peptidylprolyl isomerase [candidate division Zixibacteria bacterium]MDM7972918.1 peptidylprolyl isomerase [candidate division Zixibacteria bacterium]HOD67374.1 peptidylprolyl isomerase [candidate division Zixibacteria bacterium]HPI31879.1 peptidylprolyl isomerase [candidate division Zixibacteria bacterium]
MDKGYRPLVSAFGLLLLAGLLAGCGKSDNPTLAVVGDYEIKAAEFNDYFRSIRYPFPTAQDEFAKRREMLDTIVVNRLLIQAAYEKGIDQSEELARLVVQNQDRLLVDVLAQRRIAEKSVPTEPEIREFWEKLEYKIKASHILVDNLDTANALLARIQNGESFEKLAFDYSRDPSAKKNKGDLGYFTWGSMISAFQEAAFAMAPGEVSPPVHTEYGYHIIKLVDKLPNEFRDSFDKMKMEIKQQLENRKRSELSRAYVESLRTKFPIHVDTATCQYLLHKRSMLYPPMLLETLPRNDFDVEQLDRSEKELVLATWDNGQITVLEYLDLAKNLSPAIRPDFDQYDSLASVIFTIKLQDLLVVQAHREGMDSDPEYQRRLKLFKELTMAMIMRDDSLPVPPAPDDGMVRRYYDEHLDEFTDPAKVQVFEILLSDELTAGKLAKEIRSLQGFRDKAMDLTERPGKRAAGGDLGYIDRKWFPEIYDLAVKTPVGQIGGPVVTQGKYSIFYVADKISPTVKDFLDVKAQILTKLKEEQRVQALAVWIEERKAQTTIRINEDALRTTIDMDKYPQGVPQGEQG